MDVTKWITQACTIPWSPDWWSGWCASAQVYFFEHLAHYLDESHISNRICKAVKAILAEAGTYVQDLDPMKRIKQENIFMRKYLHIVNNIEDKLFKNKQVWDAMHLNYKGAKGGRVTSATMYRKQEMEINNRKNFLLTPSFWNLFPMDLTNCLTFTSASYFVFNVSLCITIWNNVFINITIFKNQIYLHHHFFRHNLFASPL